MGKLGDLVVHIGADTRKLNKSLGRVQRNMRSMTSNFTNLGIKMSKAITVPLLGLGALAVKSAADLEKMEVGFISLTGGAEQAANMMKQLNEFTAKTPFQIDAVATSARQLIASGTKISEVNDQLQFLGDIAATTGQPINEIAAIFAKVNAKGKVELENLNQLAERGIPVFKGLAEATGLLPNELGAGAVSVKQFNDYLKGLSEEGGFAEGSMSRLSDTASGKFSTALDNLKLAGAALAEDLLPIVNSLLDGVINLAQSFSNLSKKTKNIILVVAGVAAAIGPLLIIIPKVIAGLNAMRIAMIALQLSIIPAPFLLAGAAILALSVTALAFTGDIKGSREETEKFIGTLKDLDKQAAINAVKSEMRRKEQELKAAQKSLKINQDLAKFGDKFQRLSANQQVSRYSSIVDGIADSIGDLKTELVDLEREVVKIEPIIEKVSGKDLQIIKPEQMELLEKLPPVLIAIKKPLQELQESTDNTNEIFKTLSDTMIDVSESFGSAFGEMIAGAKTGKEALLDFVKSAIHSVIAMARANVIANATSPTNPANIASGGLLAPALALAGLSALDALVANIPALKDGGLAYGPTLAMVGDNRGANVDPEIIAPLSKLKGMLGGNSIQVYGRISGDDIVLSNSRASRDRNRF